MITGTSVVAGSVFTRWQTSKPSRSGIITSNKTRSGFSAAIFASASKPSWRCSQGNARGEHFDQHLEVQLIVIDDRMRVTCGRFLG